MAIILTKELIANNANSRSQFDAVMYQRREFNVQQGILCNQFAGLADVGGEDVLLKNAADQFDVKFWAEVDRNSIEVRDNDQGREFLTDLMGIATPLHIGKTVKAYTVSGEIHNEVKISIDGQAPITYDNVENQREADPVPIFQGGYGINWREWQGKMSENMDAIGEAQREKTKVMLSRMADYVLDGDANVNVAGYQAQGIRNHRNTYKIDLTVDGIDLTSPSTTNDQIVAYFNQTFAVHLDANYVNELVTVWVSPQIARRLAAPYSNASGFKEGTLADYISRYSRVKGFRTTWKLNGNEFFGYVKNRDVITPLVGAALATVPMPRLTPRANYNFELWAAMGLQIKADVNGRTGVFYAANLT